MRDNKLSMTVNCQICEKFKSPKLLVRKEGVAWQGEQNGGLICMAFIKKVAVSHLKVRY